MKTLGPSGIFGETKAQSEVLVTCEDCGSMYIDFAVMVYKEKGKEDVVVDRCLCHDCYEKRYPWDIEDETY